MLDIGMMIDIMYTYIDMQNQNKSNKEKNNVREATQIDFDKF